MKARLTDLGKPGASRFPADFGKLTSDETKMGQGDQVCGHQAAMSRTLAPRMPQHLKQTVRVARCRALLIVVDVDKHRAALSPPLDDMTRSGAQGLVRVVILLTAVRPLS